MKYRASCGRKAPWKNVPRGRPCCILVNSCVKYKLMFWYLTACLLIDTWCQKSTGLARHEHWKFCAKQNKQRGSTMANFQLPPPDILELNDGSTASNWRVWVAAWKNYTLATKLDKEDEARQVATLEEVM